MARFALAALVGWTCDSLPRRVAKEKAGKLTTSRPCHSSLSSCLRLKSSFLNLVTMRSSSFTRHSMPTWSVVRLHARRIDSKRRLSGTPPIVSTSLPNSSRSRNTAHASAFRFVSSVGRWHVAHGGWSPLSSFNSRQSSHCGLPGLPYHSAHFVSFLLLQAPRCGPRCGCGASGRP